MNKLWLGSILSNKTEYKEDVIIIFSYCFDSWLEQVLHGHSITRWIKVKRPLVDSLPPNRHRQNKSKLAASLVVWNKIYIFKRVGYYLTGIKGVTQVCTLGHLAWRFGTRGAT